MVYVLLHVSLTSLHSAIRYFHWVKVKCSLFHVLAEIIEQCEAITYPDSEGLHAPEEESEKGSREPM